jgi:sarcosine oxidase delta subunit
MKSRRTLFRLFLNQRNLSQGTGFFDLSPCFFCPTKRRSTINFEVKGTTKRRSTINFEVKGTAKRRSTINFEVKGIAKRRRPINFEVNGIANCRRPINFEVNGIAKRRRPINFEVNGIANCRSTVNFEANGIATACEGVFTNGMLFEFIRTKLFRELTYHQTLFLHTEMSTVIKNYMIQ